MPEEVGSEAIPTRGQLPAASHLRGVLAVLSSAARIAMKFPVCKPGCRCGAAQSVRWLGRGHLSPVTPPPWGQRPPAPGCSWPRSACWFPTVSSSSFSSAPCPEKLSSLGHRVRLPGAMLRHKASGVFGALFALVPCDFSVCGGIKPVFHTVLAVLG